MDLLFTIFLYPLETLMGLCLSSSYLWTGSYALSVIILSIVVNIAVLPIYNFAEKWKLQEKAVKAKMAPELASIKRHSKGWEKYYYTREVYRRFGYHPTSGLKVSFGFLIQIPFFFSAYHLLSNFSDWEGMSFLFLNDLSAPDGLMVFAGLSLNMLPMAMTAINLVSVRVYAAQMDRVEKVQLWVLAIFFLAVLYQSPSGLVLYWTINNAFSLVKHAFGQKLNAAYRTVLETTRSSFRGAASNETVKPSPFQEKLIYLFELPARFSAIAFIAGAFAMFVGVGGIRIYQPVADAAALGAAGILAYLWLSSIVRGLHRGNRSPREKLRVALSRFAFVAFTVVLADTVLRTNIFDYPIRTAEFILMMVLVLLFGLAICRRFRMVEHMPPGHELYGISAALTAFFLLIVNPLTFYLLLEEYSGAALELTSTLMGYWVVVFFVCAVAYMLADVRTRKGLTLLAVFLSASMMIYSGTLDIGLLDRFLLNHTKPIKLTWIGVSVEIILLMVLFAATSLATIFYRRAVVWVSAMVLIAAVLVSGIDVFEARNDVVSLPYELPQETSETAIGPRYELPDNNNKVVGFSQEQNVLIVVLDGFPGSYIEKIQNEMPDSLAQYDGFVWYPNMLTTNTATWGSVPALLGGHRFTPQAINERNEPSLAHARAQAYSVYLDSFAPQGYDISYINPLEKFGCAGMDSRVNCNETEPYGLYYYNNYVDEKLKDAKINLPNMLATISLFRVSPFLFELLSNLVFSHLIQAAT